MCFSAGASFTTSAVLLVSGGLSLTQVRSRSQIMFAVIPFVFAVQQAIEGFIWLAIGAGVSDMFLTMLAGIYLFFAYMVWPLWVPISLYFIEKNSVRRRILLVLAGVGFVFAATAIIMTFDFTPRVIDNHLMYGEFPTHWLITALYLCATIVPFFVPKGYLFKIAGGLVIVALAISWLISYMAIGSLWCFFAAVLSFFVVWIIRYLNNKKNLS